MRAFAVVALVWGAAYLTWRIGWSWSGANPALWAALLVCELFGWWSLGTLTWFSWSARPVHRPAITTQHTVDVYVCTYNEAVDVLRPTLVGCRALRYPHTTYVLDDGRRPEMRALAEECGARYMTRPDNSHAKAGNINHALPLTDGELVFVLDADHVPMPDALDALVGYFDDPQLALVQSPHDFLNHDSFQHYGKGRHEQSVFYEVICPGKDRHGAAFWCGSAAMIRRRALLGAGGVATETIAEDFHTTIRMQRDGWTSRYHDEILVQGLAPHDLASYLLQRDRWARGNLAVFCTKESPLRAREISWRQRFSYFVSLSSYVAGPVRALMLGVLAVTLWSGMLPVQATWLQLAVLWLPSTVLSLVAASALTRGHMRVKEATHFELLTAEIHLRALRCTVKPGKTTFKVTPKEGTDAGGWTALRQLKLLLVLAGALAAGVAIRLADMLFDIGLPDMPKLAQIVIPVLAVVECRRIVRSLWWVARRHQSRMSFRFSTQAPALVTADGATQPAAVVDVSVAGLGLVVSDPVERGSTLDVEAWFTGLDGAVCRVSGRAEVTMCRKEEVGYRVGVRLVEMDEQSRNVLAEHCYVDILYRQLRALRPPAPAQVAPLAVT